MAHRWGAHPKRKVRPEAQAPRLADPKAAIRPRAIRKAGAKRSRARSKRMKVMTHTLRVLVGTPGERGCPCGQPLCTLI